MYRPLRRTPCNSMIGGVCGGIAEYFDISPTFVRILYLVVSICSAAFRGILVYLLLWLIIPSRCCMCGCHHDCRCDCDCDYCC